MSLPNMNNTATETVVKHSVVSDDGARLTIYIPGLGCDDNNRHNVLSFGKIARYFSAARWHSAHISSFCLSQCIDATNRVFVAETEFEIPASTYARARHRFVWLPHSITLAMISLGRTSFELLCTMCDVEDGEVLVTSRARMVRVGTTNRRPVPLSEEFVAHYACCPGVSNSGSNAARIPLTDGKMPTNVHRYVTQVRSSDTDFNLHTNNGTYILLCMDSVDDAFSQPMPTCFTHFQGPASKRCVKTARCRYMLESRLGDQLVVSAWEDSEIRDVLHFKVTKDEKPIFYSTIEFHPDTLLARL